MVFAEGEEEKVVRAAVAFRNAGYGTPVLIGREDRVQATMASLGLGIVGGHRDPQRAAVAAPTRNTSSSSMAACSGAAILQRDCQRMVNQDRNVFAACMVATGDADAMVTGLTRSAAVCLDDISHAIDAGAGRHRLRPDADAGHARHAPSSSPTR